MSSVDFIIKKLFHSLRVYLFSKNFSILFLGTIISQFLNFIFSPVISRFFIPSVYGEFNQFLSFTSIIGGILLFRMEQSIMIFNKSKEEETIFLFFLFILGIINSIIVYVIFFLFSEWKAGYLILLSSNIFIIGLNTQMYLTSLKNRQYTICSTSRIAKVLFFNGTSLLLGYFYLPSASMLIIGQTVGLVAEFITLLSANKWLLNYHYMMISISRGINYFKSNKEFIKWNLPNVLIDLLNDWGYMLVLGYVFGNQILGYFAMMYRVIKLPANLIGSVLYQYNYSQAINKNANTLNIIKQNYLISIIIGFPIFLILFLFGSKLFVILFGDNWEESGWIIETLAPAYFVHFVIVSSSFITILKNKMNISFWIALIDISLRILSVIIGRYFNDYRISFQALNIFLCITYISGLIIYFKISRDEVNR